MTANPSAQIAATAPGTQARKPLEGQQKLSDSVLLRETGKDSHWQRYLTAVQLGMTKGDSADFAGVGEATARLWFRNAEEDEEAGIDSVFVRFTREVRTVRAQMLSRNLATVEKARQTGDWKAASWILERHGYHRKSEIEGTVATTLTYIIDEQDLGA